MGSSRTRTGTTAHRTVGWRTTDEHEIELRRERGREEIASVEKLGARKELFGDYRVLSTSGETYLVEIRSLTEPVNSCGCADHRANGLGTCKHIEGVLHRLRHRRGSAAAARAGNPKTELYLDRREGQPAVQRAVRRGRRTRAEGIVEAASTDDGRLVGASMRTLARIQNELAALPTRAREGIRLSRYLQDWQAEERERESARIARRGIERALDDGKPALDLLEVPLYPYQQQGVLHLAFTRRAILADEMGLGKTIQAVAACELLARRNAVSRVLVVTPASLKGEWAEQIDAFTRREINLVDGPARVRSNRYRQDAFFCIVNYEQVRKDVDAINELLAPEVVILDEAQRIKNWRTVTANQIKRLRSRYAFVLTGTPLENRIDEVYSIAQFLDPALFGSLFRFNREFYVLDERGRPVGYRNLDEMHRRLRPIMLRRRKEDVEGDLPGRSVTNHFVALAPEQVEQYEEHQGGVARLLAIAKRRPLRPKEFERLQRSLACMRMACDTPFILDRRTRVAPKLDELVRILEGLLAGTDSKAVVFSEWERMLVLARERTTRIAPDAAWHTGAVPQKTRRAEIRRFREDPDCRILFSTDSGSVGLNLQVADIVINLDLPWNPAKLEQRIARAWRKHQRRHVRVINLISENTIEHRMIGTLEHKRLVADRVLDGHGGEAEVALGSSRAALIERVEALTTDPGSTSNRPTAPMGQGASLRQLLERELGGNLIDLRQIDEAAMGPVTLAIVKAVDASTHEAVTRCVTACAESTRPVVEVIDETTWSVLERLVGSGVLRFAGNPDRAAATIDEVELAARRERIDRSGEALEAASRQLSLARLLVGGGFEPEARPALRESFDRIGDCLGLLAGGETPFTGSPAALAELARRFGLPDDFTTCHEALQDGANEGGVSELLGVVDRALAAATRARAGFMG